MLLALPASGSHVTHDSAINRSEKIRRCSCGPGVQKCLNLKNSFKNKIFKNKNLLKNRGFGAEKRADGVALVTAAKARGSERPGGHGHEEAGSRCSRCSLLFCRHRRLCVLASARAERASCRAAPPRPSWLPCLSMSG